MWIAHRRDVVIVGGGHAAAAVAHTLIAAGRTVATVDHGVEYSTEPPIVPLERLRQTDFGMMSHYDGESPGWPFPYEELVPHYDHAERVCEAQHPPLADPFLTDLARRLDASGLPTYSPVMGRVPTLPSAVERIAAHAIRLETDALGREALALVVEADDGIDRIHADAFVLAGGALATPALLLRSASGLHPSGIGNESGAVGRFAMHVNRTVVLAVAKRGGPTTDAVLASDGWYLGAPGWRHPLGHVSLTGSDSVAVAAGIAPTHAWPSTARPLEVLISSPSLPDASNRVTLDAGGAPRLTLRLTNGTTHRKLSALVRLMLTRNGFAHAVLPARVTAADLCGTARIGRGAMSAAADANGRVVGVENVYIADSSALPACGAFDPTLTTVAFALRVGDHIAATLGATRSAPEAA